MKKDLQEYLEEVSKYPLLTEEETAELQEAALKGNKEAEEKLYNHNLRLVVVLAKKFYNWGNVDMMSLIESGNQGLRKAIGCYKPQSVKPSAYYIWWIRSSILGNIFSNIFQNLQNMKENFFREKNMNGYLALSFTNSFITNTFMQLASNEEAIDEIFRGALAETFASEDVNEHVTKDNFIFKSPHFYKLLMEFSDESSLKRIRELDEEINFSK